MEGTFERFPEDKKCPICGTNKDERCLLVPIDGTDEGNICQAQPVHVSCALRSLRFNKRIGLVYVMVDADLCIENNNGGHECELCGAPATHFCACEACRDAAAEDDYGRVKYKDEDETEYEDEGAGGRWLCDTCGNP